MALARRWRTMAAGLILGTGSAASGLAEERAEVPASVSIVNEAVEATEPVVAEEMDSGLAARDNMAPAPREMPAPACNTTASPCAPQCYRKSRKQRHQEAWWGYPEEFQKPPLGLSVYSHFNIQIANGEAARMVLYQYDFVTGKAELNAAGKERLQKIAEKLAKNTFDLVIERSLYTPELDKARREAVLVELKKGSVVVAEPRVRVDRPTARGLNGSESVVVHQNLMQQTGARGVLLGGGYSFSPINSGVGSSRGTSNQGSGLMSGTSR